MATNESRSLNKSMDEGATDGKYRKVRPNTTVAPGTGDEIMLANRRGLNPYWNYDFIDSARFFWHIAFSFAPHPSCGCLQWYLSITKRNQ